MSAKRNYTHALEILNNGAWWDHLTPDAPFENSPWSQDLHFAIEQANNALSFLAAREECLQRCSDLEAIRELEANVGCVELNVANDQAGVAMPNQQRFIDAAKIAIEAIWTKTDGNETAAHDHCQNNRTNTRSNSRSDMKMLWLGEVIYDITTVACQYIEKLQNNPCFSLDEHDSRVLYQSIYDWACEFESDGFDGADQEDYMLSVEEFAYRKLRDYFGPYKQKPSDFNPGTKVNTLWTEEEKGGEGNC